MDSIDGTGLPTQPQQQTPQAPRKWSEIELESSIYSLEPQDRIGLFDQWAKQAQDYQLKAGGFDNPENFQKFKIKEIQTRRRLLSPMGDDPDPAVVQQDYKAYIDMIGEEQKRQAAKKPDQKVYQEVLDGKRNAAFVGGQMIFNPKVTRDPALYRQALAETDAPSDIKVIYAGRREDEDKRASITRRDELASKIVTPQIAERVVSAVQEGTEILGVDVGSPQDAGIRKDVNGIWSVADPNYVDWDKGIVSGVMSKVLPGAAAQYKPMKELNEFQKKYGLSDDEMKADYMEALKRSAPTSVSRWVTNADSLEDYVPVLSSKVRVLDPDIKPRIFVPNADLAFDKDAYDAAVDSAKAPEEAKTLAKESRTQIAESLALPTYNLLLNNRDDFMPYAEKVKSKDDMVYAVSKYYKDKKDQSWYEDISELVGQAWGGTDIGIRRFYNLRNVIPAMFGDVEAAENASAIERDLTDRSRTQEMVGSRMGIPTAFKYTRDFAAIGPDLVAQLAISFATGGITISAQIAALGARTGLKYAAARSAFSAAMANAERGAVRAAIKNIPGIAASSVDDVTNAAINTAKQMVSKNPLKGGVGTQQLVSGATAGLTSLNATFSEVYSSLRDEGMTPEQALDKARNAAAVAATITGFITYGFSAAGRGGAEDAATLASQQAGRFTVRDLRRAGVAELMTSDLGRQAIKKTAAGILRRTSDEALEEALDQFANGLAQYITNPAREAQDRTMSQIIQESIYAGTLGAGIGGGIASLESATQSTGYRTASQIENEMRGLGPAPAPAVQAPTPPASTPAPSQTAPTPAATAVPPAPTVTTSGPSVTPAVTPSVAPPAPPLAPPPPAPTFRQLAGTSVLVDNEAGSIKIDDDGTVLFDRGPNTPPIILSRNQDELVSSSEFNVRSAFPVELTPSAPTSVRDDGAIVTTSTGTKGAVSIVTDFVSEGETVEGNLFVTVRDRETGSEFELHGDDALVVAIARRNRQQDNDLDAAITAATPPQLLDFNRVLARLLAGKQNLLEVSNDESGQVFSQEKIDAAFEELVSLNTAIQNENLPADIRERLTQTIDNALNELASRRSQSQPGAAAASVSAETATGAPSRGGSAQTGNVSPAKPAGAETRVSAAVQNATVVAQNLAQNPDTSITAAALQQVANQTPAQPVAAPAPVTPAPTPAVPAVTETEAPSQTTPVAPAVEAPAPASVAQVSAPEAPAPTPEVTPATSAEVQPAPAVRDATKPEQMTPDEAIKKEFDSRWSKKKVPEYSDWLEKNPKPSRTSKEEGVTKAQQMERFARWVNLRTQTLWANVAKQRDIPNSWVDDVPTMEFMLASNYLKQGNVWVAGQNSKPAKPASWDSQDYEYALSSIDEQRTKAQSDAEIYNTYLTSINSAIDNKLPVSVEAMEYAQYSRIPSGYVKQGDLYVYSPEAAPEPAETTAVVEKPKRPSIGTTGREIMQAWKSLQGTNVATGENVVGLIVGGGTFAFINDKIVRLSRTKDWMATYTEATKNELSEIDDAINKGQFQIESRKNTGLGMYPKQDAGKTTRILHQATGKPLPEFLATPEGKAYEERINKAIKKTEGKVESAPVATTAPAAEPIIVEAPVVEKKERRLAKDQMMVSVAPRADVPDRVPASLKGKMYEIQIAGANAVIDSMEQNGAALNGDGTGVGKTRQIIAVAKYYADKGKVVFIISKNDALGKPFEGNGPYKLGGSMQKDSVDMGVDLTLFGHKQEKAKPGNIYITNYDRIQTDDVPDDAVVIFDEAHEMVNIYGENPGDEPTSQWAVKLRPIIKKSSSVAYYTATSGDKPHQFAYLHKILGFPTADDYFVAMIGNGVDVKKNRVTSSKVRYSIPKGKGGNQFNEWINGLMLQAGTEGRFVKREISYDGTSIQFQDIKGTSEENQWSKYYTDSIEKMDKFEGEGGRILSPDDVKKFSAELTKIGTAIEILENELKSNRKVVMFFSRINEFKVNTAMDFETPEGNITNYDVLFTLPSPVDLVKEELKKRGIKFTELHGQSTTKASEAQMQFQEGDVSVMLASVESGGTGINLDDTKGTEPRSMIFMFAPYRGVSTIQALGRVWRSTTIQNDNNPTRFIFLTATDINADNIRSTVLAKKLQVMNATVGGTAVSMMPLSRIGFTTSMLVGSTLNDDQMLAQLEEPEQKKATKKSPVVIDVVAEVIPRDEIANLKALPYNAPIEDIAKASPKLIEESKALAIRFKDFASWSSAATKAFGSSTVRFLDTIWSGLKSISIAAIIGYTSTGIDAAFAPSTQEIKALPVEDVVSVSYMLPEKPAKQAEPKLKKPEKPPSEVAKAPTQKPKTTEERISETLSFFDPEVAPYIDFYDKDFELEILNSVNQTPAMKAVSPLVGETEGNRRSGPNKTLAKVFEVGGLKGSQDEIPWCAMFVSHGFNKAGIPTKNLMASQFLSFGKRTSEPKAGDVVVFNKRNDDNTISKNTPGHVGFFVRESNGFVIVLNGNVGDKAAVTAIPKRRVMQYRSAPSGIVESKSRGAATYSTQTSPPVNKPAVSDDGSPDPRKTDDLSVSSLTRQAYTPGEARKIGVTRLAAELGITSGGMEAIGEVLGRIARTGRRRHKKIASDLINVLQGTGVQIKLVSVDPMKNGWYDPATNTVFINLDGPHEMGVVETILHELVHAGTESAIRNPVTDAQKRLVESLRSQMADARKAAESLIRKKLGKDVDMSNWGRLVDRARMLNDYDFFDVVYGLSSLSEFSTHATTSKAFQQFLSTVEKGGKQMGLFDRFISAIARFFTGKTDFATDVYRDIVSLIGAGDKGSVRRPNYDSAAFEEYIGMPASAARSTIENVLSLYAPALRITPEPTVTDPMFYDGVSLLTNESLMDGMDEDDIRAAAQRAAVAYNAASEDPLTSQVIQKPGFLLPSGLPDQYRRSVARGLMNAAQYASENGIYPLAFELGTEADAFGATGMMLEQELASQARGVSAEMDARHAELERRANAGDAQAEAEAQAMVDAAAKLAGYLLERFHGTRAKAFEAFKAWSHFGDAAQAKDFWGNPDDKANPTRIMRLYLNISKPYRVTDEEANSWKDLLRKMVADGILTNDQSRAIGDAAKRAGDEARDESGPGRAYADAYNDSAASQVSDLLKLAGFDGIVYSNEYEGQGRQDSHVALSPAQIKSADPFTYDADGNLIPLSLRFQPESPDIRFSTARGYVRIPGEKVIIDPRRDKILSKFRGRGMLTPEAFEATLVTEQEKRAGQQAARFLANNLNKAIETAFGKGTKNTKGLRVFVIDSRGNVSFTQPFETLKKAQDFATKNGYAQYVIKSPEELINVALGNSEPSLTEKQQELLDEQEEKGITAIKNRIAIEIDKMLRTQNEYIAEAQKAGAPQSRFDEIANDKKIFQETIAQLQARLEAKLKKRREKLEEWMLNRNSRNFKDTQDEARSFLPAKVVEEIVNARDAIDGRSEEIAGIEYLMGDGMMRIIFEANNGIYVTRVYEAFESANRRNYADWLFEAYMAKVEGKTDEKGRPIKYDKLAAERIAPLVRVLTERIIDKRAKDIISDADQRMVDDVWSELVGRKFYKFIDQEAVKEGAKAELLRRRKRNKQLFISSLAQYLASDIDILLDADTMGRASGITPASTPKEMLRAAKKVAADVYNNPEDNLDLLDDSGIDYNRMLIYRLPTKNEATDTARQQYQMAEAARRKGIPDPSGVKWRTGIGNTVYDSFIKALNHDFQKNLDFIIDAPGGKSGSSKSMEDWKKLGDQILMNRKNVPDYMRKFWGEIDNPANRVTQTIIKQSTLLANAAYRENIAKIGLAQGWAVEESEFKSDPAKYYGWRKLVSGDEGYEDNPLKDLYVHPEIYNSLEIRRSPNDPSNGAFKFIGGWVGVALWNATSGLLRGATRNLASLPNWALNSGVMLANPMEFARFWSNFGIAAKAISEHLSTVPKVEGGAEGDPKSIKIVKDSWAWMLQTYGFTGTGARVLGGAGSELNAVSRFFGRLETKADSKAYQDLYTRAAREGIADNNIERNDMARLLNYEDDLTREPIRKNIDTFFPWGGVASKAQDAFGYIIKTGKATMGNRTEYYSSMDSMTKITLWLTEMESQAKIHAKDDAEFNKWRGEDGMFRELPAELQTKAAQNVNNTVQSDSRVAELVVQFRKSGWGKIMSPFLASRVEFIRTAANAYRIAFDEINNGVNSKEKARGFKRLLSAMTAHFVYASIATAFAVAVMRAVGGGEEDDEEGKTLNATELDGLRKMLPEWANNKVLAARVYKNGDIDWADVSFQLPFGWINEIFISASKGMDKAATDDLVAQTVAVQIVSDFIGNFSSRQIAIEAISNAMSGYDRIRNKEIWEKDDNLAVKIQKGVEYYFKSAGYPGDVRDAIKMYKAAYGVEENGSKYKMDAVLLSMATGQSIRTQKVSEMFLSEMRQAQDHYRVVNRSLYSSALRDANNVDPDSVVEDTLLARRRFNEITRDLNQTFAAAVDVLKAGGMPHAKAKKMITDVMKSQEVKLSQTLERAIINNYIPKYRASEITEKKIRSLDKKYSDNRFNAYLDAIRK